MDGFALGKNRVRKLQNNNLPRENRDRRRLLFAGILALLINLALFGAGELLLRADRQHRNHAAPAPALLVVLGEPVRRIPVLQSPAVSPAPEQAAPNLSVQSAAGPAQVPSAVRENSIPENTVPMSSGNDVAELADAGSVTGPAPSGEISGSSAAFSGTPVYTEEAGLSGMIYSLIEKNKQYPALARRRNIEGEVGVRIVITESGSLEEAVVQSGSGSVILDQAALSLVTAIFPLDVHLQTGAVLNLIIRYSLKNSRDG